MPELADFQDRFAASLTDDPPPDAPAGLKVYRNTIAQGLIEVLAGAYPTVQRLMGEAWFAAEALAFARVHPPVSPVLADYGEGFPLFLHRITAEGRGWIAEVARLDRAWTEAHIAADAEPLAEPDFDQVPTLHPAARLLAFGLPAVTLWRLNRPPAPVLAKAIQPDWVPQACLVSRPADEVIVTDLDEDALAFLTACLAGATFGEAAVALLEQHPDADLAGLVARLLAAGAFAEPAR
ncbi:hypothetical protein QO010_001334 [Caulobacter ginsengisoli]|uniref:Putative DNA-binding domain-containing protein n=1 Tax=Caulobacter ginsengisoli TaxID=400775 RepID=A0ABU0INI3_9CAUL|nr:DNA-binding domain-containing protein [Caulobacter ginsengisoli]MDQ0463563.1 hypothetical protein [Caulobacter ginsengisoli]